MSFILFNSPIEISSTIYFDLQKYIFFSDYTKFIYTFYQILISQSLINHHSLTNTNKNR